LKNAILNIIQIDQHIAKPIKLSQVYEIKRKTLEWNILCELVSVHTDMYRDEEIKTYSCKKTHLCCTRDKRLITTFRQF